MDKLGGYRMMKASEYSDTSQVPRDHDLSYRCLQCADIVPSVPKDNIGCKCDNIFIDVDYHRLVVRDFKDFRIVSELNRHQIE